MGVPTILVLVAAIFILLRSGSVNISEFDTGVAIALVLAVLCVGYWAVRPYVEKNVK